ncbi:HD domain-containing protein [bacterium]|nr:HD domain-containing protein [bacterium]
MLTLDQILSSKNPFDILRDVDWVRTNFVELYNLKSNTKGHKDNYLHTLSVLENVMEVSKDKRLYYVALFHDLGKYKTKTYSSVNGWQFHGHEAASANMLKSLYKKFGLDNSTYQFVYNIVLHHGETRNVFGEKSTDSAIRRLYRNLSQNVDCDPKEMIEAFVLFSKCDLTTKQADLKSKVIKNADVFLDRLEVILAEDAKREKRYAINGNDIMETFGVKPGRDLGIVLQNIRDCVDKGILIDEKETLLSHIKQVYFS